MDILQILQQTPFAWMAPYAPMVVALCSAIDAVFPQPAEGSPWRALRGVISYLALNLGHARNIAHN